VFEVTDAKTNILGDTWSRDHVQTVLLSCDSLLVPACRWIGTAAVMVTVDITHHVQRGESISGDIEQESLEHPT